MRKVLSMVLAIVMSFFTLCNGSFAASDNVTYVNDSERVGELGGSFVIVSESSETPLSIQCSSLDVSGKLFSNAGINAMKGEKYITPNGYDLYTYNLIQDVFDSADEFIYHIVNYQIGDDWVAVNDYSEQNAVVSGQEIKCGSILGAAENILLSANRIVNQNMGDVTRIMSLNGNIQINADNLNIYGLIYAPNERVEINACDVRFEGIIIAKEVVINANTVVLTAQRVGVSIEMYTIGPDDAFTGDIFDAGIVSGSSGSSSGAGEYYYNTGGKGKDAATYDRYLLLRCVENGDIIYESEGGGGLTGHIAVVHKFITHTIYNYSTTGPRVVTEIQLIEAIDKGVCYGLLDDKRCDDKGVSILRSKQLTSAKWSSIRYFLEKQIGKDYLLVLFRKNTSINSKTWYCSELVWAAYMYAGIDISKQSNGEPGITPHDINGNTALMRINYKPRGHHSY